MKSNISKEQYKATFCKRTKVDNRYPVYVSEKTHARLKKAVNNMMLWKLSISSLVENILAQHLDTYAEQIKQIIIEENQKLFDDEEV